MASGTPEEIKLDIERTREALSRDLDRLTERVDPRAAAKRQMGAALEQVEGLRHTAIQRAQEAFRLAVGAVEPVRKNPQLARLIAAGAAAVVTLAASLPFVLRKPLPIVTVERRTHSDRRLAPDRRVSARRSGSDRRRTIKYRRPAIAVGERA
jgi:hypothetical protein